MSFKPAIVHVEFLLPPGKGSGHLVRFTADATRNKIVVRFHDLDGALTRHTRSLDRYEQKRIQAQETLAKARGLFRAFHTWEVTHLKEDQRELARYLPRLAHEKLKRAVASRSWAAVVDTSQRPRMVRNEEIDPLIEMTSQAVSAAIFVYPYEERALNTDNLGQAAFAYG